MTRLVSAGEMEESVMEMSQLSVASPLRKLNEPAAPQRDNLTPSLFWAVFPYPQPAELFGISLYIVHAACGFGMGRKSGEFTAWLIDRRCALKRLWWSPSPFWNFNQYPPSKIWISEDITTLGTLSHYPPWNCEFLKPLPTLKLWIFEAITHLVNPQPLPTFSNIPHILPQLKLSAPSYLEGWQRR